VTELRAVVEMEDGELEVKIEELSMWLKHPVTQEFRRRLFQQFDHQSSILGSQPGTSVDRLIGRAEVLQYLLDPKLLFEE